VLTRPDARTLGAEPRWLDRDWGDDWGDDWGVEERTAADGPAAPASSHPTAADPHAHDVDRAHPADRAPDGLGAAAASSALPRHDAQQVVAGAIVMTAGVAAFDVALTARLSMFFDLCFVLVGLWAALVVRRKGLYAVGVLPPLLLGAVVAFLAVTMPSTLTASHLAFVSTWLTGLAQHGLALAATHLLVLTIVGLRAGEARGGRAR